MILQNLSIVNYRNIRSASLDLSAKMNCFIGHNGAGKTNVLDAVYYLSFCRSALNSVDSQLIRHEEDFFVLEGTYADEEAADEPLCLYAGMKRGQKKHFKRNKKEYKRLSEHIGRVPLVMVSPADTLLIDGGGEERRKLMDMVISQYDHAYIDDLIAYNRALQQRNSLLKMEEEPDAALLDLWEEQMAGSGKRIFARRELFVERLLPLFQQYYTTISAQREQAGLEYVSHAQRGDLLDVIKRDRMKDRALGYSLHGVHRDDLVFTLSGHPMKREGSQGQSKTFVIAVKLALFEFLQHTAAHTTPILLLDDIFDKLDSERVDQIVQLVSGERFGQIFITDTNREHLDRILRARVCDYNMYEVEQGKIEPIVTNGKGGPVEHV